MLLHAAGTRRVFAQTDAVAIGNQGRYALSPLFTDLDDSSANLTLEQILQPDAQAAFKSTARRPVSTSTNFSATQSAIWLRIQRVTNRDAPWQGVSRRPAATTACCQPMGSTSNALLIGSALEMVLLSFALADRMRSRAARRSWRRPRCFPNS